ncbi:MAG: cysteine hydrolase family protein, partial [Candidatus Ornithospirochaeta sp.]
GDKVMVDIMVAVDLQNDFIDGVLGTKEALAIVDEAKRKISSFPGIVLFTKDTHDSAYMEGEEGKNLPVPHCIKGTEGWKIRSDIDVLRKTEPIEKCTFGSTVLGEKLREIDSKEKVRSVTLLGLCTDICVISNAMIAKAFLPEAHIAVDSDASAGVTPESHRRALEAMEMCHIEILGTNR